MTNAMPRWLLAGVLAIGLASAFPASAANRVVTVVNSTSATLNEFYASNVNTDSWEEDILGEYALASGDSIDIDIDDGTGACMFDFRGVFVDGDEVVKRYVNVCGVSVFTFR